MIFIRASPATLRRGNAITPGAAPSRQLTAHARASTLNTSMRLLFAIVSADDPIPAGGVDGLNIKGPILSLLERRKFDRVILLFPAGLGDRVVFFGHLDAEIVELSSARITADLLANAMLGRIPPAAEVFAVAGDPEAEVALIQVGRSGRLAFTLQSIFIPDGLGELLIEDRSFGVRNGEVREPRSDYAVNLDQPGLQVLRKPEKRDPEIVAREIGLIGEHPALRLEIEKAVAVAQHAVPVLIQGETGTGKGVMARFVHEFSDRSNGPFVAMNCGALPENLAESLLFGHAKGSFTGAHADQAGKFVLADNGTLFLDEVGELPLALQPKLLRVLEDGFVEPLGAARGRKVNVRVIAATHRDLKKGVTEKTFREDLYFRLNFTTLNLPPLRERRTDIPTLALHILAKLNRRLQKPKTFTPAALKRLESEHWRGNVRDLENVIGRSALMTRGQKIDAEDLRIEDAFVSASTETPEPHEGFALENYLSTVRADLMEKALHKSGGNQSAAARLLGISPQAVHKYIQTRDSNPR